MYNNIAGGSFTDDLVNFAYPRMHAVPCDFMHAGHFEFFGAARALILNLLQSLLAAAFSERITRQPPKKSRDATGQGRQG